MISSTTVRRAFRGFAIRTWIVNSSQNGPAAIGAVGELWLEGPALGQGYVDESQNAKAFVEDPPWLTRGYNGHSGRRGRLYRTGDLVRYHTDGTLIFVGRRDLQVKIRGQRVELEEIEFRLLRSLSAVLRRPMRAAVEAIVPQGRTVPMLVAFLALEHDENGENPDFQAMLQHALGKTHEELFESLPKYMVPSTYLPQRYLPMTITGKIDRRRLREEASTMSIDHLNALNPILGLPSRAPETDREKRLRDMWASVLGLDAANISADHSFFRLGGDSISAVRLVAAARKDDLHLTVSNVFNIPRLCDLAKVSTESIDHTHDLSIHVPPFSMLHAGISVQDAVSLAAQACEVDHQQVKDIFPCTPLQEGLLALTSRRLGDYVAHGSFTINDNIDTQLFKRAWESVVSACPILQTRMVDLPGQGLMQVVLDNTNVWSFCSMTDILEPSEWLRKHPFELGSPLAIFGFIEDNAAHGSKPTFVITMHHALYDGWSLSMVFDLLQKAYSGASLGDPVPYQAFIHHLHQKDRNQMEDYWKAQLKGIDAPQFPALPHPGYQPYADRTITTSISDVQWEGDYTASTIVRAAWALVLSTWTSTSDVYFGTVLSGRSAAVSGVESIIGPIIATVPLRICWDGETKVESLLRRVRDQASEMTQFEQIGLQRLQALGPDCEHACKFQSLLVVQPPEPEIDEHHELFASDGTKNNASNRFRTFGIVLGCQLETDAVQVQLGYDESMITANAAQRMIEQLCWTIQRLRFPDQRRMNLKQIQTPSQADLEKIWTWNANVPQSNDVCVQDLIDVQVRRQPDKAAICAWDGEFTYAKLDELSTKLALHIVDLGVAPSSYIPVCMEKSKWAPVAVLGVMKAGATTVLLDPSLPQERLRTTIAACSARLVITSAESTVVEQVTEQTIMKIGEGHLPQSQSPKADSLPPGDPARPLYVVFTSGSTGTPKGVVISHKNFSSALSLQTWTLGLNTESRVLDFASYSFDAAWFSIVFTLYVGGCICIPSEWQRQNDLHGCFTNYQVTCAQLTPSLARVMKPEVLSQLSIMILGGEAMQSQDLALARGQTKIKNPYGPAECTPGSTLWTSDGGNTDISIGKGFGNCTWVVGFDGQNLAPIGAVGELWIEGPTVGEGYLNDPEKTRLSFIEDPKWLREGFASHPGRRGRLYRTGDLVRYKEDANLEFVGRKDTQVKIRGQRVEVTEIEHLVSNGLPGLQRHQVIAGTITPRDSSTIVIVAFIYLDEGHSTDAEDAKEYVRSISEQISKRAKEKLPSYMRPSLYVPLDTIPLTPTGKVDRQRLKANLELLTSSELLDTYGEPNPRRRRPSTEVEKRMQQLWAEVLGTEMDRIGVDDSFVSVGSDSIKAMRLATMARQAGFECSVADVLMSNSLGELAEKHERSDTVRTNRSKGSSSSSGPGSTGSSGSSVHTPRTEAEGLVHVQTRVGKLLSVFDVSTAQKEYIDYALSAPARGWNYFSIDFPTTEEIPALAATCRKLVERYDAFRTIFISNDDDSSYLQAVFADVEVPLDQVGADRSVDELFDESLKQDQQYSTSLGETFLRFRCLRGRDAVRLVFRISHALYDGMSLGYLARDFGALHRDASLPEAARFADYLGQLVNPSAERHPFWRNLLSGSELTKIPTRVNGADPWGLPVKATRTVKAPQARSIISPATIFTTACAVAVMKRTGLNDVVLGRLVAGRASLSPESREVVGPCLNTIPLRVRSIGQKNDADIVQEVQRQCLDAIPYESTSFGDIVRECTDWSGSVDRFGCVVHYQNVGTKFEVATGEEAYEFRVWERRDLPVPANFFVISAVENGELLHLKITAGPSYTQARVDWIVEELRSVMIRFTD